MLTKLINSKDKFAQTNSEVLFNTENLDKNIARAEKETNEHRERLKTYPQGQKNYR